MTYQVTEEIQDNCKEVYADVLTGDHLILLNNQTVHSDSF